jgi:uncharacterized protein (TIGR02453 family)
MDKVLEFLTDLSANNNREWYNANKKRYEESREKIFFLTDVFINEIRKFDPEVPALSPKDCVFRIFRDVRFSNDKRPYKTNFGAFIAKGGKKSMNAGYYFHIDPEGSFAGGGVYMPPAEPLKAIREYMAENGGEFLEIINNNNFKKIYPEMYDGKLKTAPKGFPKDHEYIDLLRYKSFVFSSKIDNSELSSDNLIEKIVGSFRQLYPVNRFLNDALVNNL